MFYSTSKGLIRVAGDQIHHWTSDTGGIGGSLNIIDDQLFWLRGGSEIVRVTGDKLDVIASDSEILSGRNVFVISRPGNTPLWVIGQRGAFEIAEGTTKVGALDTHCADSRINDIERLDDQTFAVATSQHDIIISDYAGQKIRRINRGVGLADNAVLSLFTDRDGSLWAGLNSGLAQIAHQSPVTVFDGNNGPTPGRIDGWFRVGETVYAGSFDGIHQLMPPNSSTGESARFERIIDSVTNAFAFSEFDGDLIFSSSDGLYRLRDDGSYDLFVDLSHNPPKLMADSALVPNRIYAAGQDGLTILERTSSGFEIVGEVLDLGVCFFHTEEEDGDIWLGSYTTGISRIPRAHQLADLNDLPVETYFRSHGLPEEMTWSTVTPGLQERFSSPM